MRTMFWIAILLIGCETKEHANAELDALAKAQKAAAKASAHANAGDAEEIGVVECDAYIRSYENCLSQRVPADRHSALRATLEDEKRKWHAAMIDGASKETLAQQCRSAASIARTTMGDYGCEF